MKVTQRRSVANPRATDSRDRGQHLGLVHPRRLSHNINNLVNDALWSPSCVTQTLPPYNISLLPAASCCRRRGYFNNLRERITNECLH